jgi:hypothetical protein
VAIGIDPTTAATAADKIIETPDSSACRLRWHSNRRYPSTDGGSVVLQSLRIVRYTLGVSVAALVQRVAGRIGNNRSLNYRSFPRITVIDHAGSVYMPSGVAAIVMFLSSAGVLQYCTRATDPTKGWLMCLASSMTR